MSEMFRLGDTLELYLVRHPKPSVAAGLCYGISDLPVAQDPATCAARLRPLLPDSARMISSPLQRARLLAFALQLSATSD